jgi:hypothetical protein
MFKYNQYNQQQIIKHATISTNNNYQLKTQIEKVFEKKNNSQNENKIVK